MYRKIKISLVFPLFVVALASCIGVEPRKHYEPVDVIIVDEGLYQINLRATEEIGPEKVRLHLGDPGAKVDSGPVYHAKLGQSIGFYFMFKDSNTYNRPLTVVIKYPEGGVYDEVNNKQVYKISIERNRSSNQLYGHMLNFTHKWELVKGTYTLSILDNNIAVATRDFYVEPFADNETENAVKENPRMRNNSKKASQSEYQEAENTEKAPPATIMAFTAENDFRGTFCGNPELYFKELGNVRVALEQAWSKVMGEGDAINCRVLIDIDSDGVIHNYGLLSCDDDSRIEEVLEASMPIPVPTNSCNFEKLKSIAFNVARPNSVFLEIGFPWE